MNEEDIKKQLQEKNKEIYLNKLNLDLANNLEVLVLSIENLLNNISEYSINRILKITESFGNQSIIKENINSFLENYRTNLMKLLEDKKINLEQLFIKTEDISIYDKNLKEIKINITNELNNYYQNNIEKLIKEITKLYNDSFCNLRIEEYLRNVLKDNLNNKIGDVINNRDIILLNTFKESYLKYQELNKNTIGNKEEIEN
ncbi:MAG: hypothetical protein IKN63_00555 [Bacilli bacterium]|nr:hypothetical protein [Bacilli bacterium]